MTSRTIIYEKKEEPGVGQAIYSGAAGFGRVVEFIAAILATFAGIGLIAYGIWLITQGKHGAGWWSIGWGVTIILIGWFFYWLTKKSKFIAAVAGVGALV